jgi:glycerol-3-phosphate O-acyltransferase/dihydroxyacetone phosphate acyltransferase
MTARNPAPRQEAGRARRRLDALSAGLARLLVRIFFRQVERVGGARLPPAGPALLVANHQNGMIDSLVILAALPPGAPMPRFLAAHVLWRNPALRPWLELGGVIPIFRQKDAEGAAAPAQNLAAFARCHEELAAGGRVALFPEGISHSEPGLAPLKTGAARIVLETARRFPGVVPLIVPVGLLFEAKGSFRSRALVEIGEPIDPTPEILADRAAGGPPGAGSGEGAAKEGAPAAPAVRALTARIDAGLRAVTLSYGSWEEARRIGRAAELFSHDLEGGAGLPGEAPLAARSSAQRAFVEGYAVLSRRFPQRTAAAATAVERYDGMLRDLDLRDDQVAAVYPAVPVLRWLGRTVLRLLVELPVGLLGVALNWLPYRLVGEIAARATREPDMPASFKVFGGIVFFPLAWCLEAALAARLAGPPPTFRLAAAAAVLLAGPISGWMALRFDDRRGSLWREARAFLLLRSRRAIAGELRRRRAAALGEVSELARLYREPPAGEAMPPASTPAGR